MSLSVTALTLKFDSKTIFADITFTSKSGELTLIKGKNGSGKTCLLQCLCSVIPKHFPATINGEISINPHSELQIPNYAFSFLFQDPDKQLCFPFIEEELFFGAENLQRDRNDFDTDYEMLIKSFPFLALPHPLKQGAASLPHSLKQGAASLPHPLKQGGVGGGLPPQHETHTLSFGQKKALLFAGMILKDSRIYLLDEPFAGLSDDMQKRFLDLILLLKSRNKIVIIAEHLPYFDDIANNVVYL